VRRRILVAIVGVTAVSTLVLTVPLAVIIARRESTDSVRELQRAAQRTSAGLSTNPGGNSEHLEIPATENNLDVAVYWPDGTKIGGRGPARFDEVSARARSIEVDGVVGGERVLADPVLVNERLVAVVRAAEPATETTDRVRRDVLVLVLFDLVAIGGRGRRGFVRGRPTRPAGAPPARRRGPIGRGRLLGGAEGERHQRGR
jgi:hypothetical protein